MQSARQFNHELENAPKDSALLALAENARLVRRVAELKRTVDKLFATRMELEAKVEFLESREGLTIEFRPDLRISPSQLKILSALLAYELATKQRLHGLLYAHDPSGGADPKIVDVLVCKLRQRLKPHGISIETCWGRGYFLTSEMKEKLKTFVRRRE